MKYIVEHLEGPLDTWATLEYIHMCEVVRPESLVFTKFPEANAFAKLTKTDYSPATRTESLDDLKETVDWRRTCLLDMDATQPLTPEDGDIFDTVVFGGILGNVPSDDRTSEIRCFNFDHRRHLGEMQMTTNTAILVAKIVTEDRIPLDQLPYVDHPEIQLNAKEFVELPFRYLAASYFTKSQADRHTPVLPKGMLEYLKRSSDGPIL